MGVPSLLPLALGLLPVGGEHVLPGLLTDEGRQKFARSREASSRGPSSFHGSMGGSGKEALLLRRLLEVVASEDLGLSSSFGLRSLRKGDGMYHEGENYWRGDVWIHVTYLVLRGIRKFYLPFSSSVSGDGLQGRPRSSAERKRSATRERGEEDDDDDDEDEEEEELKGQELGHMLRELYRVTRQRAVRTVEVEWEKKRSFFERYSDTDGAGKGPHPFAGWTTTYLLLLSFEHEDRHQEEED